MDCKSFELNLLSILYLFSLQAASQIPSVVTASFVTKKDWFVAHVFVDATFLIPTLCIRNSWDLLHAIRRFEKYWYYAFKNLFFKVPL